MARKMATKMERKMVKVGNRRKERKVKKDLQVAKRSEKLAKAEESHSSMVLIQIAILHSLIIFLKTTLMSGGMPSRRNG